MKTSSEAREHFAQLVRAAQRLNQDNPVAYYRRLLLLAIIGYAFVYVFLFFLVSVLLFLAFPYALFTSLFQGENLIFILLSLIWVTWRLFSISTSNPKGYHLNNTDFPRLYKTINKLQKKLATPEIQEIILVPEFNAAIAQISRAGIMKKPTNTLVIGLDLMMATTPEQLTAIIAHELGHLSGRHGDFNVRISRIRATWSAIMKSLNQVEMWGGGVFRWFFNGYVPYLNAYALVLAWRNEYQADTLAAEVTSAEVIANALLYTAVYARYSDEVYWQKVCKRTDSQAQPPRKVYEGLYAFHKRGFTDEALKHRYIDEAYETETSYEDTHPALKDRIAALKTRPTEVVSIDKNAASYFLGEAIKPIVKDFSAQWYEAHKESWLERYQFIQTVGRRLNELEQMQANPTLAMNSGGYSP